MRTKDNLEAFIDGYNTVHVYMEKGFYDGVSRSFHLKDQFGEIVPLSIGEKVDAGTHYCYVCTVDAPIKVGREYVLYDSHCRTAKARYSHIVKTKQFADHFSPSYKQYGCIYKPAETTFRVWTPVASSVEVVFKDKNGERIVPMQRNSRGEWSVVVKGDLRHSMYVYRVHVNGEIKETYDPYNLFTGLNTGFSQVNSIEALKLPEKVETVPMKQQTDAIVYEASIRDMSAQKDSGFTYPKTFAAFTEENETTRIKRTGLSYIRELGVTHVQLMPVLDFGSVDEEYPTLYYNWGYDPAHYMGLEGSYSIDPFDPESRVVEFARLVQDMHKAGLKVTLDLVFNHVWDRERFGLDVLIPDYYFLMDSWGNYSNGSMCGNDIDSRPEMSRRYLVDAAMQLIDIFDVDGFRFDLMGVLDYTLLNEIAKEARKRKPDFMIYGEGWDMNSFVPHELRASQSNQMKMPQVGHFSDRFRNVIRGDSSFLGDKGYPAGKTEAINDVKQVMAASIFEGRFDQPYKVVNYVECHDNHTMWDKNRKACEGQPRSERMKRQNLTTAMVMLAQGIPFIHCGQEFGRTKQNLGNTYDKSDHFNMVDYHRRDEMDMMVEEFKALVRLRKEHSSFRLGTGQAVRDGVETSDINGKVLVYQTKDENERLVSFFNPTNETIHCDLHGCGIVLHDSAHRTFGEIRSFELQPVSVVVVSMKD